MTPLAQTASVAPWLYWSIFPIHRAFLKLYFGDIVVRGLEHLPELRQDPGADQGAKIVIHVSSPLYAQDYRQENDKQTALALTQALQAALLKGLETIESV